MKLSKWPGYPGKIEASHQPDLRPAGWPDKKGKYINQHEWTVTIKDKTGSEWDISVPAGFVSDGASVPRIAWTISGLTPDGLIRAAALVHDMLCRHKGRVTVKSIEIGLTSETRLIMSHKDAHRLFYDLMKASGMNWRANTAYIVVRLIGPRW